MTSASTAIAASPSSPASAGRGRRAGEQRDAEAVGDQRAGGARSDPGGGAGDDRDAAGLLRGAHAEESARRRDTVRGPVRGATTSPPSDRATGLPSDARPEKPLNAANDIAEFLTTRRARITPEQAGLPSYGQRRVPGLRRRGSRVVGRRQRGLLPASGARLRSRCLRARARSAGRGAAARRGRARAHLFDLARAASPVAPRRSQPVNYHRRSSPSSTESKRLDESAVPAATTCAAIANCKVLELRRGVRQRQRSSRQRLQPHVGDAGPAAKLLPWGLCRLRARGVAAFASRPQPLRPQPAGPHRGAVDAQRRVPGSLGGAQRALPPGRAPSACTTRWSATSSSATRR